MRPRKLVGLLATGLAGLVLAFAAVSRGGPADVRTVTTAPGGTVPTVPGQGGGGCAGGGTSIFVNSPYFSGQAGTRARVEGCAWYPSSSCSNRVKLTLKAEGKTYELSEEVRPDDSVAALPIPNTSSKISGSFVIPEEVNRGRSDVSAKVYGKQPFDFNVGFGCFQLLPAKSGGPGIVTIKPATMDSSVLTEVRPLDGSAVRQDEPLELSWNQSRAGRIRIRVWFELTRGRAIPVRRGAAPDDDAVLNAQRAAGPNRFSFPLASPTGDPFPVGRYAFQIELLDAPGSMLVPARPKGGEFVVGYAR